ncbi:uncharacterized protein LOC118228160 [Anguilla anguilla]|uniref:uncharacterized protein LOC118228160 n=1 Tax=Anguilla anguilla TaxID=7936 RepID=UPI0015A82887|nr:uncharacterized protein LOC118228160 [Anguilla anguilla]
MPPRRETRQRQQLLYHRLQCSGTAHSARWAVAIARRGSRQTLAIQKGEPLACIIGHPSTGEGIQTKIYSGWLAVPDAALEPLGASCTWTGKRGGILGGAALCRTGLVLWEGHCATSVRTNAARGDPTQVLTRVEEQRVSHSVRLQSADQDWSRCRLALQLQGAAGTLRGEQWDGNNMQWTAEWSGAPPSSPETDVDSGPLEFGFFFFFLDVEWPNIKAWANYILSLIFIMLCVSVHETPPVFVTPPCETAA